jgi:hypothetical protein
MVTSPATTLTDAQTAWCRDSDQLRLITSDLPAVPGNTKVAARIYDTSHAIEDDALLYADAGDGTTAAKLGNLARHLHNLGDAISAPVFGFRAIHKGFTKENHAIEDMTGDLNSLAGSC